MRRVFWILLVSSVTLPVTQSSHGSVVAAGRDRLSVEERVECQLRLERLAHARRIEQGPEPKPTFEQAMPPGAVRTKVERSLALSAALGTFWQRPLTALQLQAEIDRLARDTKQPDRLREMFAALGDDPFVIAECLARPLLAERLAREWYAFDQRFHGALEKQVEAEVASIASGADSKSAASPYSEAILRRRTSPGAAGGAATPGSDDRESLDADSWDELLRALADRFGVDDPSRIPIGTWSPLERTATDFEIQAVLERTPDSIRVASVRWEKTSFDAWWEGVRGALEKDGAATVIPATAAYELPVIRGSGCGADDTWRPTQGLPNARFGHSAVWTGAEMIVWGGGDPHNLPLVNSGGRYDPATDSWTPTSVGTGVPGPRHSHTAVWTGTEMVIWGGYGSGSSRYVNTGARYNPTTDRWAPTSVGANVPSARSYHSAVWTGTEMLVWGGLEYYGGPVRSGGRYDPLKDAWLPIAGGEGVPTQRYGHTAVWTGSEMIVWGGDEDGVGQLGSGGRYDPATDRWTATSVGPNAPLRRYGHTAVWTGTEMIVWGGYGEYELNTGGRYDPATDSWRSTDAGAQAPLGRSGHTAVWTGTEMIVWGGAGEAYLAWLSSGGRYDPVADRWVPTAVGASVPRGRRDHTAVWTGTEMIVWGGRYTDPYWIYKLNSGGRYDPARDSWVPTNEAANVPTPRRYHTAVWTGTEMIVWGGHRTSSSNSVNTGGRYDPATDLWLPTSLGPNVPSRRDYHTAVWTGTEMIVWGGSTATGGRYDPATDSWTPTRFDGNTPSARSGHTAVWTGREMIVWGGTWYAATGGRYDPLTDRWQPTSVADGVPVGRDSHVAVWTGTEMIVWGGAWPGYVAINSGGRYNPATDRWVPTSADENLPHPIWGAAAVWTGKELVVWGGSYPDHDVGARYDPTTDTWRPTSMGDAPEERSSHTAVWTGSEMIVWGGWYPYFASGGRYDPSTDRWRPTGLGPNVASPRRSHTAVWTGTEMIVWGGSPLETWGGLYCATPPADNTPPHADGGDNQILECAGDHRATATLDGSQSTDADSTPGTNDDIVRFDWTENGAGLASGEFVSVPFALGVHAVALTVTDSAGATDVDDTLIVVRDTLAPAGRVVFPAPGQCFGSPALPVTVTDDFAERCDPHPTRAYRPQGGPAYTAHGDVDLLLTVTDSSGNEAADERSFTIDLVPPVVTILSPPQQPTAPGGLPFSLIFVSADEDAASGGPIREVVLLDDCALYDGSLYGDGDGLLSDEALVMDEAALCRAALLCQRREWRNPVFSVEAWDCGGNRGEARRVVPGSYRVPTSRCP